ncbi:unnamed protein product [Acanthocheilonema viteae]|uniref:Uncharacterized protein n=1 Tax=Acanthocheilonema viteae TaxID=6277 RepID=A0A498S2Y2_ACAVI|nr:unnamed protein product [Acanthocheilonema viteae]
MEGSRRALYSYSWQQSPINKRRRANPPDEEKKIFDDWFEEKADEYFPWIRNQGLDNETIRAAKASLTSSSPPCNLEIYRGFARVSPKMILEQLQKPKQDQKTLAEEEARKKAERLANITRYERSLKETRKTIDRIKKEKQRKVMFSQTQHQSPSNSVVFPEHLPCNALSEVSSFQEKPCKIHLECYVVAISGSQKPDNHGMFRAFGEQMIARMENGVSDNKKLERKLKSDSFSSTTRTSCNIIGEREKQITSSESKQQTSVYHEDDESDNELLRLAFESSPIQKSNSAQRIAANEDELSDEALLAMMISSPMSSPKLKKNKRSTDSYH